MDFIEGEDGIETRRKFDLEFEQVREGDCPAAPSRAPGCGVHWSEAETLDGRSGRIRRRVWAGRAGDTGSLRKKILSLAAAAW